MGALYIPEARPSFSPDCSEDACVSIDCRRVPARLRAKISVPCLGGLDAAMLLNLRLEAGDRTIELLDRGWCKTCPAGGKGAHPAQAALDGAAAILKGLGMAEMLAPRIRLDALPVEAASPVLPDADSETPITRRAFFGRLAAPVQQAVNDPGQARKNKLASAPPPHPSLARQRVVQAMTLLAQKYSLTRYQKQIFPAARIDAHCLNHQGCTRVCPTGALQAYEESNGSGVRFAAAACIDCGLCEQHCPEQALRIDTNPQRQQAGFVETATLSFHQQRTCEACGSPFTPVADDPEASLCDPCGKSRQFAKHMFQQLFDTRA
jgi:ferredoxin